jgi:hypothetical protein
LEKFEDLFGIRLIETDPVVAEYDLVVVATRQQRGKRLLFFFSQVIPFMVRKGGTPFFANFNALASRLINS